jgi:hypothetical protein
LVDDDNFDAYKFGNHFESAAVPQTHSQTTNYQKTQVDKQVDNTRQHFYHQMSVIGGSAMPG